MKVKGLMRFQAPESLSEQIAQHLGQRIITGQLKPGERIQELKIAGELDVSRGSVREALLILERRHLIEIYPRRGAVVSQLTPELVNSLYDVYGELLCVLGKKLLERWASVDASGLLSRLKELEQRVEQHAGDAELVIEAGFELMRLAYRQVDNPFLEETLENFRPAISRTYYVALESFRNGYTHTRDFFVSLAKAASAGDSQQVDQIIRDFAELQRSQVLAVLSEQSVTQGR